MNGATIFVCVALCVGAAWATTVGEHSSTGGFCYSDADGCGPHTKEWPGVCQDTTSKRQSPIDLPNSRETPVKGEIELRMDIYQGSSFRMANNGHSVTFDFVGATGTNAGTEVVTFPDPVNFNITRQYKFASGHLHWSRINYLVGSEHTISGVGSAMELHLVHYLAEYPDMNAATASGDESALNVLGVLINVDTVEKVRNLFSSLSGGYIKSTRHESLKPIIDNIDQIKEASHDPHFVTVNQPLNLSELVVPQGKATAYSYKGSLTTPGCNEQVNWFVIAEPSKTSSTDLDKIRNTLLDGYNKPMKSNHRPTMPRNGRTILHSHVRPVHAN